MIKDPIPANVLIVDDNPAKLTMLETALAGMDIQTVTATSGKEALRKLLAQDFAVILLDVIMPIMDGFETANLIRCRPRSEHLPIIFITAEALTEDARLKGYEIGAVDYIISPVLPTILRAKVATFVDLYRMRIMLHEQAIHDDLTGLYNRRYLNETLKREIESARRKHRNLAVIMIDLDFFKRINDAFGHEAGDAVLAGVGRLLLKSVRICDIPCRYGGEEFTLLLPDCDIATAAERAEILRCSTHELSLEYDGETVPCVTLSLGVAAYPLNGETSAALLAAADAALYLAKQGGRDRVEIAARHDTLEDAPASGLKP